MKLEEYLSDHGISEAAFAEQIGVTQPAINRYRKGRVPEPEVMQRITRATGGAVTPNDFFDMEPQKGAAILQPLKDSKGSNASLTKSSANLKTSTRRQVRQ